MGSSCELVDAFVILTRQGVVLASDDADLHRAKIERCVR